jgi:hypothetical protein
MDGWRSAIKVESLERNFETRSFAMPWIDGGWLDYKLDLEQQREETWRLAHPTLWRIRNFFYWVGWLHQ